MGGVDGEGGCAEVVSSEAEAEAAGGGGDEDDWIERHAEDTVVEVAEDAIDSDREMRHTTCTIAITDRYHTNLFNFKLLHQ